MTQTTSGLQDIALFVEVARLRSFSAAARELELSTATVSRRIAAFERQMGARLFNRSTRRVELTSVGERYFERCTHLMDEARSLRDAMFSEAERPSGHLRVSMPVDLGTEMIGPLLPHFARLYPAISFDIDLSPHRRDLVAEPVDVALRLGTVRDPGLVSRRIGWVEQGLFASPAYLERHGTPMQPSDLVAHDCIHVGEGKSGRTWRFEREGSDVMSVKVHGRFCVNNHSLMRSLAERDMGVAMLAPSLCREAIHAGRLIPVLPGWSVAKQGVYAVTSSRLRSATVRAFVEFVANRFSAV